MLMGMLIRIGFAMKDVKQALALGKTRCCFTGE
jgi:hypothetical protein